MTKKNEKKIPEPRDIPTVVIAEDDRRYAVQLVPDLPAGVDVCVQIREGATLDLVDAMHAIRGGAILGYFTSCRADFERMFPAEPPSTSKMRVQVRASSEVVHSPEEELQRAREAREARAREEQQRRDREQRAEAERQRRMRESDADRLRRELDAERTRRVAAETQLARIESEARDESASAPEGGSQPGEAPQPEELGAAGDGEGSAPAQNAASAEDARAAINNLDLDGAGKRSRTRHRDEDAAA